MKRKRKVKRPRSSRRAFTPAEQSFFDAGERLAEQPAAPDSFDDLDDGRSPDSFWSRLTRRPAEA